jgi:hypothetical protein
MKYPIVNIEPYKQLYTASTAMKEDPRIRQALCYDIKLDGVTLKDGAWTFTEPKRGLRS